MDQLKATIRQPTVPHGNFILIGGTMQARYQYGNLTIRKRKKGPDVWQFRWTENGKPKSVLIGTLEKYPAQADAERAVEHLRVKINAPNPQEQFHTATVGGLIDRFMQDYAPKRCRKTRKPITVASSRITSAPGGAGNLSRMSKRWLSRTGLNPTPARGR